MSVTDWPNDVDGDVFRRLEENGFDFSRKHKIDFEVDFDDWPPAEQAIILLQQKYPTVMMYDPEGEDSGYVHLELVDFLTYELVIRIQTEITLLITPFGGRCDSWGVMERGAIH